MKEEIMPTVLAIDDKPDNLVSIAALLKLTMPDVTVLTAQSGQEGIAQAQGAAPDVILLDIVMPKMDGYEVCQRLRADSVTQHIPIIMLTALETDAQSRIKALQIGADAFLTKPIDEGELCAQINVMLRIRRAENLLLQERDALDVQVQDRTAELEEANRELNAELIQRRRAEQQLLDNQAQLKSLASELVLAEERERTRIATHMHDDVCQNLAYSKMKLQMVHARLDDQTQMDDMTEVSDTLTRMMQDVRTLTFELSSPVLTEFGLEAAVSHWLTEQVEQRHGIATAFTDDGQPKPLEEDIRALLFRSVRELLANVVKHSKADQVGINISRAKDQILIRLEDDGIGFAPDQVVIGKDTGGFGLFSIRERRSQMGGSLEIDSSPSQGCRSILRAPLIQS